MNKCFYTYLDPILFTLSKPSRSYWVKAVLSLLTCAGFLYMQINSFYLLLFPLKAIFWSWEKDDNFDNFIDNADVCANAIQWVDMGENPASVSSEWTGNDRLGQKARR